MTELTLSSVTVTEKRHDAVDKLPFYWNMICRATKSDAGEIFLEFHQYVRQNDHVKKLNQLVTLSAVTSSDEARGYRGTWLHHIVLNEDIALSNLIYPVAILIASGADFERTRDENGFTAYTLMPIKRYFGYQIFLDIDATVKVLRQMWPNSNIDTQ